MKLLYEVFNKLLFTYKTNCHVLLLSIHWAIQIDFFFPFSNHLRGTTESKKHSMEVCLLVTNKLQTTKQQNVI